MMADLETRTFAVPCEVREDSGTLTLEGYASTFNEFYDLGAFRERVAPTAFARTLANGPDVRLLIDHEGQPLARTKSGTLVLSTDDSGFKMRATLDPTDPDVQRLVPKMRRGDLDQMSFAFRIPAGGDSWNTDYSERTINEVNMSGGDVSVVTYPANPGTSVSLRSKGCAAATLAEVMFRELRAGKTLSAANVAKLQAVLASLADADVALDQAQADLAVVLGVPNPDAPEMNSAPALPVVRDLELDRRRLAMVTRK
jgi:HK97 family phage prohead protease